MRLIRRLVCALLGHDYEVYYGLWNDGSLNWVDLCRRCNLGQEHRS